LNHLGGIPKILVPDNLKAAVIKSDRYEPELNRVMEDFANHYGFVVIPARSGKPKDKALVENEVKILYSRVYAKLRNDKFFSLEELNAAVCKKMVEHNQTRMQNRDYSRQERFLYDEKEKLRPLPETTFEKKYYALLTVGNNGCIYLGRDKHYYSVPYKYTGERVQIIYTRTLVKIFCKDVLIATHQRHIGFGYTTVKKHLCSSHNYYLNRSPQYYIEQTGKKSNTLKTLIENVFNHSNRPPEMYYKTCEGLLNLQKKSDPVLFEKACQTAIDTETYRYHFVRSLIENKSVDLAPTVYRPLPVTKENWTVP
jgi:hypothetical protein